MLGLLQDRDWMDVSLPVSLHTSDIVSEEVPDRCRPIASMTTVYRCSVLSISLS